MDLEKYIQLANDRREYYWQTFGGILEKFWEKAMEQIREKGIPKDYPDPDKLVFNIIENGDYCDFDDLMEEGETDEEFIAREKDCCEKIYPEERIIVYDWGW